MPEVSGTGVAAGAPDASSAVPLQGLLQPSWFPEWVPEWVLPVLASILVVVLSWALGRLLVRLLGRRLARRFERPSLTRAALRGVRLGAYLLGFFVILRINGVDLGSIALSVTVFSAVLGVILAPIVGSFISGVFLLADQPYEIGDMIELDDGTRGFVEDITLRYTKILTLDNTFLVVPNGSMRDRDVVNYSAEDTRTRLSLDVLVTYESDVGAARTLIENAARKVDVVVEGGPGIRVGAARYPAAPTCYIEAYADNGVNLRLRYWAREPYKLLTIRSRVQEEVWEALEAADADIEIAYPHSHLVFDETSGELRVSTDAGEEAGPDAEGAATRTGGPQTEDGGSPGNGGSAGTDPSPEDR